MPTTRRAERATPPRTRTRQGREEVSERSSAEIERLIEELRAHELELESQNKKLRRAVQAVRESEKRHRALFELNPNPMFVWDEGSLRVLAVNDAALKLYGWRQEEFLQLTVKDLRPQENVPAFLASLPGSRALRAASVGTWRHRKKDGTVFDVDITISGLSFEGRRARLVMVRDITERNVAEENLRASEERLRMVVEGADLATWEWDVDTDQSTWNARQFELLGLRPGDAQPSAGSFLGHVHPDDRPELLRRIVRAVEQQGSVHEEFRVVRDDGQIRWLEAKGRFLSSGASQRRRMFGVNTDITARKELESALKDYNARLEQRVAERTAELEEANEALRREMGRRRGLEAEILTASEREQRRIGHDLHDGLCQVTTGAVMLSERLARALREKKISTEARMARRLVTLVASIADEARRLSHGLSPVVMEAYGLVTGLRDLARSTTRLTRIPCTFDCPDDVATVDHTVDVHLFRIAQEAVNNAVRHARPQHIKITLRLDASALALTVVDDGCGLPREPGAGGGLGLKLMRHRADLVGGTLRVERARPRGTAVTCVVPASVVRGPGLLVSGCQ